MQKNQTALFLGICFPCSSLQSDFLQKYPRQKMTFHTNWLNCYRNWFSEIHGAAEEQPLFQLTVQEFSGQYKQSLWGLSMSWEYFWHSNYNALNTSDSLSASIYIFKQCMFNICTFSFFSPAQPHQRKRSWFVAKPLMSLFTGNVLGKTCGMQPHKFCSHCPQSGQGPAPVQAAFVPQKAESLFASR